MITLDRSELAAVASMAARMAVAKAGVHQGWQEVRLVCADGRLILTAMDVINRLEISVACEGEIEPACVHAATFSEMLNLLPAETVEIKVEGGRLKITGGRGRRALAISPADGFPNPEFHPSTEITIPGDRLRAALDFTMPHAADPADIVKRAMSGVHLFAQKGKLQAIGTDANEVALIDIAPSSEIVGITINPKVAEFVAKLAPDGPCLLKLTERMAEFSWDGVLIRGPLIEDPFPLKAIEHALGKDYKRSAGTEADTLMKALQSIRAIGMVDSMSRSRRVKMTLNGIGMVSTESGEGSAEQEFVADWQGEPRQIGFASARMDRILRHFGGDVLSIGIRDDESAMKIEAAGKPDRLCLLFPLKI